MDGDENIPPCVRLNNKTSYVPGTIFNPAFKRTEAPKNISERQILDLEYGKWTDEHHRT